jgi:hypothetical protein
MATVYLETVAKIRIAGDLRKQSITEIILGMHFCYCKKNIDISTGRQSDIPKGLYFGTHVS